MAAKVIGLSRARLPRSDLPAEVRGHKFSDGNEQFQGTSIGGVNEHISRGFVGYKDVVRQQINIDGGTARVQFFSDAMHNQVNAVKSVFDDEAFRQDVRSAMGIKNFVHSELGQEVDAPGITGEAEMEVQFAAAIASMQGVKQAIGSRLQMLVKTTVKNQEKERKEKPRRWRTAQTRKR